VGAPGAAGQPERMGDGVEPESAELRVLFVEDDEGDATRAAEELRRSGWRVTWTCVDSAATMREALERGRFDLVVSEAFLPRLTATEALGVHARLAPDLPFIVVSSAAHEDQALESLRRGARDFFVKGRLDRFGAAVARELAEADARRGRRRAEREREEAFSSPSRDRDLLRAVIDGIPALVFVRDARGRYTLANQALADLWGTSVQAIVGHTSRELGAASSLAASWDRDDRDLLESGQEAIAPETHPGGAHRRPRWFVEVRRRFQQAPGAAREVLAVATDVTERRKVWIGPTC
jgi:PAS domain S-box-containing protein